VTARLLGTGCRSKLGGAKVLVVNPAGRGRRDRYKYVASQKADGYSIVWNSNSISTTFHSGMLPFDYHEFDAVARVLVESPVLAGAATRNGNAGPARRRGEIAAQGITVETPGSGVTPIFLGGAVQRPPVSRRWTCLSARRRWCRACSVT